MRKKIIIAIVLGSISAQADVLTPVQRFFGMGGQVPDYAGEAGEAPPTALGQAPYSPADSDLGVQEILMERPDTAPILVDFSTAIYRTDNAPAFNPGGSESSWVSSSRLSLAWRPHLIQGWFGDIGAGQDILRYDRSDATDFENTNLRLGTYKIIPDLDNTVFYARYEYQRVTTTSFGDGDYNAQRIRAGLQKIVWAAPRHQLSAGISGAYEWATQPDSLERNEMSLDMAYRYSFTDSIYTLATARAARYSFDQDGRDDWTYGLGLELVWQVNRNFRASASMFFDKNDSDTGTANEYEAWSAGLGIGAQWLF